MLGGCATGSHSAAEADNAYQPAPEQALPVDTFALLREATDHEALYTLVGGLKPMSTGIWRGAFAADTPDLAELRGVRAALAPLRNDIWYADVQVFSKVHDGERAIHAFVVHRDALARMIDRYEGFWSPWGITPCTHPTEIVAVVDRMPKADRWRGYGYLFGYPAEAVDFFVEAGLAADDGREVGPGKDRQFVQIPTYAAKTGRFTYAAPLHHEPTAEDEALVARAVRGAQRAEGRAPLDDAGEARARALALLRANEDDDLGHVRRVLQQMGEPDLAEEARHAGDEEALALHGAAHGEGAGSRGFEIRRVSHVAFSARHPSTTGQSWSLARRRSCRSGFTAQGWPMALKSSASAPEAP